MSPLEPPDCHFLDAATGWLMLGNAVEARVEFDQIGAGLRMHPLVLEFEWRLLAAEKRWPDAVEAGERLLRVSPDDANAWVHRSFALHELRRTREAFDLLLPAVHKFPEETIIPYNLACYTCQLGDLTAARRWFEQALALDSSAGEKLQRLRAALEDPDLRALWPELQCRVASAVARRTAG
jgi:tetratricopeptide (TPR) repeat protein